MRDRTKPLLAADASLVSSALSLLNSSTCEMIDVSAVAPESVF